MIIKTELNRFIDKEVADRDINSYNRYINGHEVVYDLNSSKSFRFNGNTVYVSRVSFKLMALNPEISVVLRLKTPVTTFLFKAHIEIVNNGNGSFYQLSNKSFEELINLLKPKKLSVEDEIKSLLGTTDVLVAVQELVKEREILKTQNLSLVKKLKSLKALINEDF